MQASPAESVLSVISIKALRQPSHIRILYFSSTIKAIARYGSILLVRSLSGVDGMEAEQFEIMIHS